MIKHDIQVLETLSLSNNQIFDCVDFLSCANLSKLDQIYLRKNDMMLDGNEFTNLGRFNLAKLTVEVVNLNYGSAVSVPSFMKKIKTIK